MPLEDQHGLYIELNTFLRVKGLASTGGRAKLLIRSGAVLVNEKSETRNRKKLREGDEVSLDEKTYLVKMSDF